METNPEISGPVSKNQQHQRQCNIKNRAHGNKTQDRRVDCICTLEAAEQPGERDKERQKRNQHFRPRMTDGRWFQGDWPQQKNRIDRENLTIVINLTS